MQIGPISVTKEDVFSFFKNAQVQSAIRTWLLAPSGWFAIHAAKWLGLDTSQLGDVATWAIYLAPYAVINAWAMLQRTHQAIVVEAARILAQRQAGTIVVNPETAPPKLVEAARSQAQGTIVAAGTDQAKRAGETGKVS